MVVLVDGVKYQLITPESERVLEETVQANHTHVFGPASVYFNLKQKMMSRGGVASIPDGYAVLFEPRLAWCIVEIELSSHPLYDHVVAQLTKFNRGIDDSSERRRIVDLLYTSIKNDPVVEAQVRGRIKSGEIYKFVSDLVSQDPVIVIVIDQKTAELEEALMDIRGNKKVVEFKTYQRVGVTDPVHAYVFDPVVTIAAQTAGPMPTTTPGPIVEVGPGQGGKTRPGDLVNKKPFSFEFLGQTCQVRHWQDILLKICELMRQSYPDRFDAVLLDMGSSRYRYFSKDKDDLMDGQGLLIPGSDIYAATKLNAGAMVARCRQVIQEFGHNPDALVVRIRGG